MRFVTLVAISSLFFLLASCEKETDASDLQVHFEGTFPLNDLDFKDGQCYAVGGRIFTSGFLVQCDLETNESSIDSIQSRSLFSIDIDEDIVCAGVYTLATNRGGEWKTIVMPDLYIMRGSIIYDDKIYAVGGAGLSSGVRISYDLELNDWITQEAGVHDLYFIETIEDKIFYGGYGQFVSSKDLETFDVNELEGHFLDIEYAEEYGHYLLNASGSILHSTNDGVSWTEIKKPNTSGVSDFKDLEIKGGQLYIAGENRIEFSSLDLIEWQSIPLAEMASINKLKSYNERLYFVTETGKIASIAN